MLKGFQRLVPAPFLLVEQISQCENDALPATWLGYHLDCSIQFQSWGKRHAISGQGRDR